MIKFILGILLIGLLSGCVTNSVKYGLFISECKLYDTRAVKLDIKPDQTFQYYFAYNDETVIGKWHVKQDTLILVSEKFLEKREPLNPKIKNSDLATIDAYLIKGKLLKLINLSGISNDCPLKLSK